MYTVYRISSLSSSYVYYGFCQSDKDPLLQFLDQSEVSPERGDAQYIANNGGRHALEACTLETCEHALEALIIRNRHRSNDKKSYTKPSNWPGPVYSNPKERKAYETLRALLLSKTARDAYAAGMWVTSSINLLGLVCGRSVVLRDLDHLTPVEFDEKYFS